jgi:hypothetical protein
MVDIGGVGHPLGTQIALSAPIQQPPTLLITQAVERSLEFVSLGR